MGGVEVKQAVRRPPAVESAEDARPRLVFFYGRTSGPSRRVEAYLAQVLQRHQNHSTFALIRVEVGDKPELARRFAITEVPTLVVVAGRRVRARIEAPHDRVTIERALAPWLL
jgi:thioredoxin-like negative regulator of GroEL